MQSAFCTGRKCVRPARHEDLPRAGASDISRDPRSIYCFRHTAAGKGIPLNSRTRVVIQADNGI